MSKVLLMFPYTFLWPFRRVRWGLLEGFEQRRAVVLLGFDTGCWTGSRMPEWVGAGLGLCCTPAAV